MWVELFVDAVPQWEVEAVNSPKRLECFFALRSLSAVIDRKTNFLVQFNEQ